MEGGSPGATEAELEEGAGGTMGRWQRLGGGRWTGRQDVKTEAPAPRGSLPLLCRARAEAGWEGGSPRRAQCLTAQQ